MFNQEYHVGDVVCANYIDFDGAKRVGIFLVVYDESEDAAYEKGHTNLTVVKITSNVLSGNKYVVKLYKGEANLEVDCFVSCSKVHTFLKEQVYKKLGSLSTRVIIQVFKETRAYHDEVSKQILSRID